MRISFSALGAVAVLLVCFSIISNPIVDGNHMFLRRSRPERRFTARTVHPVGPPERRQLVLNRGTAKETHRALGQEPKQI
jgi:hypothetical protein